MKLYQIVMVDESGKRTMAVTPNLVKHRKFSLDPIELSFHPYLLSIRMTEDVMGEPSLDLEELAFDLAFNLVDEQQRENAFRALPPSKSLLLLAEFNEGLNETMSTLDFSLNSLSIVDGMYVISLKLTSRMAFQRMVLNMVALFLAIDSLLYARGLMRNNTTLKVNPELLAAHNLIILNNVIADDIC